MAFDPGDEAVEEVGSVGLLVVAGVMLPRRGPPGPCLSFCLIHLRPGPFTCDHPSRVRAGHGRWRTPVNTGQHCWKACWGQPLRSSNLLSSATLTCVNIGGWPLTSGLIVFRWAHLWARSHSRRRVPLPISVGRLCLVKGITDEPERGAHAPKRAPYRSGLAGTVRDRRIPAYLQTASH